MFGDLSLTSQFTKLLARYTDMLVDIHYIKHKGLLDRSQGGRITIAENIKLKEVRELLYQENAVFKNSSKSKHRENVYFSWSRSNTRFNIAFVDDLSLVDAFKRKNHFCLVQTSQSKYQAYFLLDRYISSEELYRIQKVLCFLYKGDTGALSVWQLKRVPGFLNTKYEPPFLIKVVYTGTNAINVDSILEYYKQHFETHQKQLPAPAPVSTHTPTKTWQDFSDTDKSRADMRYTCYLVRVGLSDIEITQRLIQESPDIEQRKGRYLQDYISRTIQKAREYVSTS